MSSPFDQQPFGEGLGGMFEEMQRLQRQLAEAEAEAGGTTVVGTAGGSSVRISVSGEFSFEKVEIDPVVVQGGDTALIEDLVLAAVRDASSKLIEVRRRAMGQAVGGALSALLGTDEPDGLDKDEADDDGPPSGPAGSLGR